MTNDGNEQDGVPVVALRRDDLRRRHRAGVEEDADERQAHRDLVGDHLGRRPQPAEQRVRRAAGPAGQHDAVDADRGHGQDVEHRDRQVGELQRASRSPKIDDLGPERDDREGQERRRRRDDRRQDEDRLSAAFGMMSSFSASLMPSARLCSRPNGPTRLGPMRCCMRATTRRSDQMVNSVITTRKTKIDDGLADDQPPRVVAEAAATSGEASTAAGHRSPPGDGSRRPRAVSRAPRSRRTRTPSRVGRQPHDAVGHRR